VIRITPSPNAWCNSRIGIDLRVTSVTLPSGLLPGYVSVGLLTVRGVEKPAEILNGSQSTSWGVW
jgi:hypothetical protein